VAYAENFHGGGFWFRVIWWSFVFGVRCLRRHSLTSFRCFQTNVLAKFVDIKCIFLHIHSLYFICHCTEYKLSALQVRLSEKNKFKATTQQFISAKITGCALKQGSETHSSQRQSNLQLQNQVALRSRQIRAVEDWRCAAGLTGAHPGLQDRTLLKHTRIENADKVRKKKIFFLWYIEVHRPVTRRGKAPLRKNFAPTRKICWTYFESIGHSLKNLSPFRKLFAPWCGVPSWLRAWRSSKNLVFLFPAETLSNSWMAIC